MKTRAWIPALLLCTGGALRADTFLVDFESFTSQEIITTQVPDLVFSDAIVLTAGISLNELEFPPYSGSNVVSDDGGPITIAFLSPVFSIWGYFNYVEPLTLTAFDSSNNPVASAVSAFSSNDALYGDPGSMPNELLMVSFSGGISSLSIEADPLGGSLTLDDLTYETGSIPEPSSFVLISGVAVLVGLRRKVHR